jgi:hypothetical protein
LSLKYKFFQFFFHKIKTLVPVEPFGIVDFLVESDDGGDVVQLEVGKVGLRRVQGVPVVDPAVRVRAAEGQKLLRYQPVEVAVLKYF